MRIAIFSDTYYPQYNGVATVVKQSAQALAELGHEVCVVTASKSSRKELEVQLDNKVQFINIPSVPFWAYKGERFTLPLGWSLRKIRKFKPDIIHSHTSFAIGLEALMCAKLLKIPLVGTHHTFFDHYLKHVGLDYDWAKKLTWKFSVGYCNKCDLLLNPSKVLSDQLIQHGFKKTSEVVFNPTDTNFFVPPKEGKKILKSLLGVKNKSIVYSGRVSYEKDIDQIIKAFVIAKKSILDLKFVVLGDGPEKENLQKLSQRLGVDKDMIFLGRYYLDNDFIKKLCANEIFITASCSENMPVSVLEVMACGMPIIAARAMGLPEIVKDDNNGYLFDPGNIEQLAEKIVSLLNSPELLKKLSEGSRNYSLQFSLKNFAKTLEQNYLKLLNK